MLDEIVMPFFQALGRSRHLTLRLRFTRRDNGGNTYKCFWMYWSNVFFFVFFVFFQMGFYYVWITSVCVRVCACVCVFCQAVYSASFPEDIPVNKGILTVAATDADSGSSAEIQYSLFGIGVEDFYMDANTGKYARYHRHNL